MNQSPKTSQRCCWMKPDPVVHLVCVMMLSRCSACHQGTALKWGKTQRGETVTKVQGRAMRCSCTNIIVLSQLKVLFTVQYLPPVDLCVMCPGSPSLTCFAVVAVEVLRKVQASNLLLKKLNTRGIYFSCSCWNTRNVLFFLHVFDKFLSYFNFSDLSGD